MRRSVEAPGAAAKRKELRTGLTNGAAAYVLWGVFPLYFHILRDVSPLIVLCHRILWSCLFLLLIVTWRKEWREILPVARDRKLLVLLSAGALLIATNWLVFIYSVESRQVLQSSLGYFINPIFSVALGLIFLGERLRPLQWVAVAVATGAVANLTFDTTGPPWIALTLALSFGLYGLVRKQVRISSLHALLVESVLLSPIAALILAFTPGASGGPAFRWLSVSGILTATPLLLFGAAVRRLKLSTMGFLQYIGPSIQFGLAVLAFREPLDSRRLLSFVLCWIATGIFMLESLLARKPPEVADEPE